MTDEDSKKDDLPEGIPKVSDPFVQKYLNGRNGLVAQEKKQRSGSSSHAPVISQ